MPEFSKMFAKRLSEAAYKQLQTYLGGGAKFNELAPEAKNVMKSLTKAEIDRSFDEQEKLFEMKTKLITDKFLRDTDEWDQFELVYRTFMLGSAARNKIFKLHDTLVKDMGASPGGVTTKASRVDPYYNYNTEKWNKIVMDHFWDDKKNTPGFANEYRGMTLAEQQTQYRKDFFSIFGGSGHQDRNCGGVPARLSIRRRTG